MWWLPAVVVASGGEAPAPALFDVSGAGHHETLVTARRDGRRGPASVVDRPPVHLRLTASFVEPVVAVTRAASGLRNMLSCGSGDSCENSGDAPPTRACDAGPNRLSAVFPAAFRISSGTRPTDGMYAGGYPQSSPKTTRCCGILPTATTISGASAIWDAPHRPACGSAADTRWTPCGRYRPSCPRYPASDARGGPSEHDSALEYSTDVL